jgi:hypothetical protein
MSIKASEATVGNKYLASDDIPVEVLQIEANAVTVRSGKTGNTVTLPLEYQLRESEGEIIMTTENTAGAPAQVNSPKRGAKSALIDEGLRSSLPTDEIVRKVLEAFPDLSEKNVRNLVSVRRSKLKKLPTA